MAVVQRWLAARKQDLLIWMQESKPKPINQPTLKLDSGYQICMSGYGVQASPLPYVPNFCSVILRARSYMISKKAKNEELFSRARLSVDMMMRLE